MPHKACNARLIIDGYDVSSQSSGMTINLDVPAFEYDVFQTCTTQVEPGTPASTLEHNGYFYGVTAGNLEYELQSRLGSATPMFVAGIPDDTLPVVPAYVIDSTFAASMKIDTPVKELIAIAGKWPTGLEPTARGYMVYDGTISATGAKTQVDFGAGGIAGGRAFLFVRAIVGTATSADIAVQSATTGGGSYATEGTFTFNTAAADAFAVDLTGTVDRYIRINCTDLGGATSFDVTVIVCVNDVTQ